MSVVRVAWKRPEPVSIELTEPKPKRPPVIVSGHVENDDWRHFTFARSSGLPLGYFKPHWRRDITMYAFCAVIGVVLLLLVAAK